MIHSAPTPLYYTARTCFGTQHTDLLNSVPHHTNVSPSTRCFLPPQELFGDYSFSSEPRSAQDEAREVFSDDESGGKDDGGSGKAQYKEGDAVDLRYRQTGRWYPGTVTGAQLGTHGWCFSLAGIEGGKKVGVTWTLDNVLLADLRPRVRDEKDETKRPPSGIRKGDCVSAKWYQNGQWYDAKVTRVYDDGRAIDVHYCADDRFSKATLNYRFICRPTNGKKG